MSAHTTVNNAIYMKCACTNERRGNRVKQIAYVLSKS